MIASTQYQSLPDLFHFSTAQFNLDFVFDNQAVKALVGSGNNADTNRGHPIASQAHHREMDWLEYRKLLTYKAPLEHNEYLIKVPLPKGDFFGLRAYKEFPLCTPLKKFLPGPLEKKG